MKRLLWSGVLACLFTVGMASAASVLRPVALPTAEGSVAAAAFSPDSSRLAIMRNLVVSGGSSPRHIMQIVELRSGQEVAHADVLSTETADLATSAHMIAYSSNGRYLLLATKGSDTLAIIDGATLQPLKRIALHPEVEPRTSLGQGHRYFRGVVSLATAAKGDLFGVLTHDELQGNEVFIGSFSSGQILKGWSLAMGRTATQLGQTSLSLSDDGSRTAVSSLPDENSVPKGFNNLRLYNSSSGEIVKSIRTDGLIGQIMLLSGENVLASRIDTPGPFSRKTCIENWNFGSGSLDSQFCDKGQTVSVALAASAGRVIGFASRIHKSIEGQVYAATGRVDVWDFKSGNLIASSAEIPRFVSSLQVSASGEWVMADQMLLQLSTNP